MEDMNQKVIVNIHIYIYYTSYIYIYLFMISQDKVIVSLMQGTECSQNQPARHFLAKTSQRPGHQWLRPWLTQAPSATAWLQHPWHNRRSWASGKAPVSPSDQGTSQSPGQFFAHSWLWPLPPQEGAATHLGHAQPRTPSLWIATSIDHWSMHPLPACTQLGLRQPARQHAVSSTWSRPSSCLPFWWFLNRCRSRHPRSLSNWWVDPPKCAHESYTCQTMPLRKYQWQDMTYSSWHVWAKININNRAHTKRRKSYVTFLVKPEVNNKALPTVSHEMLKFCRHVMT